MCSVLFQKQLIAVTVKTFLFDFLATAVGRTSYNTGWRTPALFELSIHEEEEYPGRTWSLSANHSSPNEQSPNLKTPSRLEALGSGYALDQAKVIVF